MDRKDFLVGAVVSILILFVFRPTESFGQNSADLEPLELTRISRPIRLDGRLDEPAWMEVEPLTAFMSMPHSGADPSEQTEFLVAYDADYMYFGGRLLMEDASHVRATTLKRDDMAPSSDFFVVLLDCFRDSENALAFGTNPAGMRWDGLVPDDAVTGRRLTSWSTFWDVAVQRTERGWFAEMRIPFSSLRFQPDGNRVVMGLTMFRWIARKTEIASHPLVPDTWGMWGPWKASQTRPVVLHGVRPRRVVYTTPYVLGGQGNEWELNDAATAYGRAGTTVREAGLDLKYGVSSNLTLDVTVNPDFAQVEADDQQVNLTRFSLFYPEKRLFFQERASVFEFGLGGSSRLFYSRRVGLDAGRAVRILGGARLVGRVGDWDVGFMDLHTQRTEFRQDDGEIDVVPSENLGVLRLRRRVLNEASYVGGLVTTRVGPEGRYDGVLASDAILRVFGQDYVTLQLAGRTADDNTLTEPDFTASTLARVFWERRGVVGMLYEFEAMRAGSDFRPALGFLPRKDFTKLAANVGHGWRPGRSSAVLEWSMRMVGSVHLYNETETVQSAQLGPSLEVAWKSGHLFYADVELAEEDLERRIALPMSTEVPPGRYRFPTVSLRYYAPWGLRFRPIIRVFGGGYFDGVSYGASASPSWRPSANFEMGAYYRVDRVEFPDRQQAFTAHVARLRAGIMPSVTLSFYGLAQYNSASDVVIGNFRLRYNPREGNDLYIVYNHVLNTGRAGTVPLEPFTRSSTLMIKYSHTFVF
jgi:hypothetical protein